MKGASDCARLIFINYQFWCNFQINLIFSKICQDEAFFCFCAAQLFCALPLVSGCMFMSSYQDIVILSFSLCFPIYSLLYVRCLIRALFSHSCVSLCAGLSGVKLLCLVCSSQFWCRPDERLGRHRRQVGRRSRRRRLSWRRLHPLRTRGPPRLPRQPDPHRCRPRSPRPHRHSHLRLSHNSSRGRPQERVRPMSRWRRA